MNEELDHFFPDRNHLRHFPDDAYPAPRGERSRSRRSCPRQPIRLRVFAYGVALGFLAVAVIALTSCAANPPVPVTSKAEQDRQAEAIRQKQFELLEQQHKGLSKAMRDFKFGDSPAKGRTTTKEQAK